MLIATACKNAGDDCNAPDLPVHSEVQQPKLVQTGENLVPVYTPIFLPIVLFVTFMGAGIGIRIGKWLSKGKCVHCGKRTSQKNKFTDDPEDSVGYPDWCHDECHEALINKEEI